MEHSLLILKCISLVTVIFISGCVTKSGPPKGFQSGPVRGVIGGKDWQMAYAFIDPTADTPEEDDFLLLFLPYKPAKECPTDLKEKEDSDAVLAYMPLKKKAVRFKARGGRTLVFSGIKKGQPYFRPAKKGKVELQKLGKRIIEGKIFGVLDGANYVSGEFKATRCSLGEMREVEVPW